MNPEVKDYSYKISTATEVLNMDLPETEYLLYPFIPKNGISLLYAERGAGKTFMALAMACAVASGFDFLNFKASKPCKVMYIDGEMDSREMQDRLNMLVRGFELERKAVNTDNIKLFLCGLQSDEVAMPDLAISDSQERIEKELESIDLIIIDNIYALYSAGDENKSETWSPYNKWSRDQRKKGRSVLWLHHTGKDVGRGPRGSSAIEAFLNFSIGMEVPSGHKSKDGAKVEMGYHKSRGVTGEAVNDFCARLESPIPGTLRWVFAKSDKTTENDKLKQMKADGKTPKEISEIMEIPLKTVYKKLK